MNLFPLINLPETSIDSGSHNQKLLKTLRKVIKPEYGFFMLRYHYLKVPTGTFTLGRSIDLSGRWLLGRIRQHKTQPGRYEILVWRGKTCYYLSVDSTRELADELRFMDADADGDLSEAIDSKSPWTVIPDTEFTALGFE